MIESAFENFVFSLNSFLMFYLLDQVAYEKETQIYLMNYGQHCDREKNNFKSIKYIIQH